MFCSSHIRRWLYVLFVFYKTIKFVNKRKRRQIHTHTYILFLTSTFCDFRGFDWRNVLSDLKSLSKKNRRTATLSQSFKCSIWFAQWLALSHSFEWKHKTTTHYLDSNKYVDYITVLQNNFKNPSYYCRYKQSIAVHWKCLTICHRMIVNRTNTL